jgi:hypothetical protein
LGFIQVKTLNFGPKKFVDVILYLILPLFSTREQIRGIPVSMIHTEKGDLSKKSFFKDKHKSTKI